MSVNDSLYQQVILEHNRKPKNFGAIATPTHKAEGFNPICGDHLWVYVNVDENGKVCEVKFEGQGCAISKASASMMTVSILGKTMDEAKVMFSEFQKLLTHELNPDAPGHHLGRLTIFSGIWKYPARVKCAALAWHALKAAIDSKSGTGSVSTE